MGGGTFHGSTAAASVQHVPQSAVTFSEEAADFDADAPVLKNEHTDLRGGDVKGAGTDRVTCFTH